MKNNNIQELDISFDRELFLRTLLRELSGTLEEVVGIEEASGYISIVGQKIGDWMNEEYKRQLNTSKLSADIIPAVLVDLKDRIQGGFSVVSVDSEKIVLSNHTCPFGDSVIERQSLCMMTSNVFGTVTAENNGYAKVALPETIAAGYPKCKVIVYLTPPNDDEGSDGVEYYSS